MASPAKIPAAQTPTKQAAYDAARKIGDAAGASAARTPAPRTPRTTPIGVHLTDFAPGCAGLAMGNPKRWRTLYGRTPAQALRATLVRLRLEPKAVQVCEVCANPKDSADIELRAAAPDKTLQPFAIFYDGVTADQARAALAAMVAEGWTVAAALARQSMHSEPQ